MNADQIELAIAKWWDFKRNIIVPNISDGLHIHECDLLIVTKAMFAIEVEIKISFADLKKDREKRHQHDSNKIKQLYFAVPYEMYIKTYPAGEKVLSMMPEHAGLIVVDEYNKCRQIRVAKINTKARKLTNDEIIKVLKLGVMRTWGLRERRNYWWLQYENELSKAVTV